ncbi:MAG TPA: hypothetical protein VLQ45_29905 [Thermoanaerobaculia bacterium]|nr:hypothetical protein [Thermoanaerobaculia bacterium]
MLLRLIGSVLLLASLVVVGKLIYDSTILQFWTAQWVIGVLSVLFLTAAGLAVSFRNDDDFGIVPFFLFGPLYAMASVAIYCSWAWLHATGPLGSASYFGHMILWCLATAIGFCSLLIWASDGTRVPFRVAAWFYALANLAVLLGIIFKYLFRAARWSLWPFLGEVVVITVGAIVFLKSHDFAEKVDPASAAGKK